jgi:hypothetical protein
MPDQSMFSGGFCAEALEMDAAEKITATDASKMARMEPLL